MKTTILTLCAQLILLGFIQSQHLAGEYFVPAEEGELILRLQYAGQSQLTGTLTDLYGAVYTVQAQEEEGDAFGTLSSAQGASYFTAYREGDQLLFTLIPPDANQQPDYGAAQEFLMKVRGGAPSTAPVSPGTFGSAQGNSPAISGPLGRQAPAEGEQGWNGTFSGNINGTPTTMVLQSQGKQLNGQIDAGGYKYSLQGMASGSQSQGQVADLQTNGKLNYTATLNGNSIDMTFNEGPGQQFQMQFTRGASPQPGMTGGMGQQVPANENVERDSRLVGGWSYTDSYTSGEYSFASQYKMQINPDGTYLYGDGRVVGGGPGIGGDSGNGGDVSRGQWKTQNSVIYINTGAGWQAYAGYYIEGASLMLKFGDGSKQVWKRSY